MGERPEKLPYSATHIVRASRALTWGEKAVWLELLALDQGPEGAWISDASLAERLGLHEGTVKNYRFSLRRRGLAVTIPRPGARQVGWVVTLPAAATPAARVVRAGEQAVGFARMLDEHIALLDGNPEMALSATRSLRSSQRGSGDQRNAGVAREARRPPGRGGRGGGPPSSSSGAYAPLHPAVTETEEDREGATHPNAEDGEGERPKIQKTAAEWKAELRRSAP